MTLADLDIRAVGQVLVAQMSGEIDLSNAVDLRGAIGRELSNQQLGLVLDLTAVDYLDSAGIQLIYDLREELRARGQKVVLALARDAPIAETLRIVDLSSTVAIAADVDAAVTLAVG